MKENKYYTYGYLRQDGTPYYIGKGHGQRVAKKHLVEIPTKDRIIFYAENLPEEEAFELEEFLISEIGRKDLNTGPLLNRTSGGGGIAGYKHTKDAKRAIAEKLTGSKMTESAKAKMSEKKKDFWKKKPLFWCNDGKKNYRVEVIPEGMEAGKLFAAWSTKRPVEIRGERFESRREAADALGIQYPTLARKLKDERYQEYKIL